MTIHKIFLLLFLLLLRQPQKIERVNPPFEGFYVKKLDCNGIIIRSSGAVHDDAFLAAAQKLNLMLSHIPVVRQNLTGWGTELHIIGKNQQTSDLPEFKSMKGVTYKDNVGQLTNIDDRTRGMGNSIYLSCGEENLLDLPDDRYAGGQDICIHEFAHTIMDFGLDEGTAQKIADQYHQAMKKGLWKGAYASVNEGEYWAELSMWYFGKHGEFLPGTRKPEPGARALQQYDPGGYTLLDEIYSGKLQAKRLSIVSPLKVAPGTQTVESKSPGWFMVTNNTPKTLELFFVDAKGSSSAKEQLKPYTSTIRPAALSQVWQVGPTTLYKITGPYCRLVIP